jgi:sugar phosphate isomerase/epimerase
MMLNKAMKAGQALEQDRRTFLKTVAVSGGAFMMTSNATNGLIAQTSQIDPKWKNQIGIELGSIGIGRSGDYESTLKRIAEFGYREVEPFDGYNNMEPLEYKALLDKYSLKMRTTHATPSTTDLEKQLERLRIMGVLYTEVPMSGAGRGGPGVPGGAPARGTGETRGAGGGMPQREPMTLESAQKSAAEMNKYGAILKKFGMKILFHNHAGEFELLKDSKQTQYDVILAETDPDLVTMQIDIGWAYIASQNILELFKKHPGRFEL